MRREEKQRESRVGKIREDIRGKEKDRKTENEGEAERGKEQRKREKKGRGEERREKKRRKREGGSTEE